MGNLKKQTFPVLNMHCAGCANNVEKTVVRISFAITAVTLNKATTRAAIILFVFIINLVISY